MRTAVTRSQVEDHLADITHLLDRWQKTHARLLGTVASYTPDPGSDGGKHLASTLEGWARRVLSDAITLSATLTSYSGVMRSAYRGKTKKANP